MCIAHVNRVSRQIRATLDPGAYRMDKLFALVEEAIPDPRWHLHRLRREGPDMRRPRRTKRETLSTEALMQNGMLVLRRKPGQVVMIGDDIRIMVLEQKGSQVLLGVQAPADMQVHRLEVYEARKAKTQAQSRGLTQA